MIRRGFVSERLLWSGFMLVLFPVCALAVEVTPLGVDVAIADVRDLDEVVVTATREKAPAEQMPFSLSVVPRDDVEHSKETALFQVLGKNVPGVFVTERSVAGYGISTGSAGGLSIRGLGASSSRVLMLIDGHPQFMGLFGHPIADAYMAQDVERVEVVRGPASVLYGSGAMGGAVNVITRRLDKDGRDTRLTYMAGSYGTQKYRLQNEWRSGRFSSYLSLNHDRTSGHRDNMDYRNTAAALKLGYDVSSVWNVAADVTVSDFMSEYPGLVSAPLLNARADVLRVGSSVGVSNQSEKTGGTVSVFYNYGDHEINDGNVAGNPEQPLYVSDDRMYGLSAFQWYRLFPSSTATVGVDYKYYGGDATKGTAVFADNRRVEEYAMYGTVQQKVLEHFILEGGLRVEHSTRYGSEVIPQGGLTYQADAFTVLRASVAKGFRSPNLRELYMFPPANDALRPEKMMNYEAGVSRRFFDNRVHAQLAVYYSKGDNLIQTVMVQGAGPQNQNIGRFRNRGVELSLDWEVSNQLNIWTNYSFLDMENPMPYAPRHNWVTGGSYTLGAFRFDADYQFVKSLYIAANPAQNSRRETFGLLDAQVSYAPVAAFEFFVKGDNVLENSYQTMEGFPMPGITGLMGMRLKF